MKVKIKDIKANPNNPRVIRDEQFKKLVKSIQEFPEMLSVRRLVCTPDMVVLGGNMRLKALQSAGIKEVDVEIVDWDEQKQKEFIIKDNVSFGEWNHEQLANEWDAIELQEWGLELPVNVDVETLEAVDDEYEMPDAIHSDVVLGDLIEIGEHRLLCGDSTDSDAVAKLMNGKHADMVFTDPPYDMTDISYTDNIFFNTDGHVFILNAEQRNVDISSKHREYLVRWYAIDFRQAHLISNSAPMTRADFIAEFRNSDKSKFVNCNKGFSTLLQIAKIHTTKGDTIHKQEKKIELPFVFIEHFTKKRELILDLFLGSGTTMVASQQLNRVCYGMELDTKYCQVIIDRMMKAFPELPVKINGKAYKK